MVQRRRRPKVTAHTCWPRGAGHAGADAVVHLAAIPDPEASWERLLPANVVGVYQVVQAAVSGGVRRLVLASSLHAVSAVSDQTQLR
jgi:nucleoside-diphosphate-sugar epimerase